MNKILKSIGDFLKRVFGDIFDLIELKAPQAVVVVQRFKEGIETYDGDIEAFLDLTNTDKDDKVYEFIKNELPKIAKEIAVIDGLVDGEVSDQEALKIYVAYILSKQKAGRVKDYVYLAAKILGAILGKQLPIDLLIMGTQRAYRILFKK
tara:strand:- start:864 stop:1313 length:450 start_codon:yes stop_codon:yes gene_type:complete